MSYIIYHIRTHTKNTMYVFVLVFLVVLIFLFAFFVRRLAFIVVRRLGKRHHENKNNIERLHVSQRYCLWLALRMMHFGQINCLDNARLSCDDDNNLTVSGKLIKKTSNTIRTSPLRLLFKDGPDKYFALTRSWNIYELRMYKSKPIMDVKHADMISINFRGYLFYTMLFVYVLLPMCVASFAICY